MKRITTLLLIAIITIVTLMLFNNHNQYKALQIQATPLRITDYSERNTLVRSKTIKAFSNLIISTQDNFSNEVSEYATQLDLEVANNYQTNLELINEYITNEYNELTNIISDYPKDYQEQLDLINLDIDQISTTNMITSFEQLKTINDDLTKLNEELIKYDQEQQAKADAEQKAKEEAEEQARIEEEKNIEESDDQSIRVYEQPTYINGILLVNKQYGIGADYPAYGLTSETQSAFNQMQADAALAGFDIYIQSGFRSYDYQVGLYNNYIVTNGQAWTDKYSAKPGHSEHQTGLSLDYSVSGSSCILSECLENEPGGQWVLNNAHNYGFIIRYPKGKEAITGYNYEPWHLRYVGVGPASDIYNSGLTLEEYLGVA